MNRSAAMRSIMGLITMLIYAVIGVLAWPSIPLLTYTMGVLIVVRLVLWVRQLPSKQ